MKRFLFSLVLMALLPMMAFAEHVEASRAQKAAQTFLNNNGVKSAQLIYAQVIDDTMGKTLAAASTVEKDIAAQIGEVDKKGAAKLVGKIVAERAQAAGIKTVVFDRGGYIYTGRVAELAAGAREAGLDF